jgi:hypothetical protein
MRRAVVVLVLACGCPHGQVRDDGDDGSTTDPPPPSEPVRCGDGDQHMRDYLFVPRASLLAASIDLSSPEVDAALAKLRDHASTADLPVRAAFSLGQWHWQVPLLRDTLARRGIVTGELVAIAMNDGLGGWVAPLGCTQHEAIATVRARGSKVDDAGTIAVVAAIANETAWDLVIGPGSIATLAPAGRGRELAARLEAGLAASLAARGEAATGQPMPGDRLAALAAAPVRVVIVGHGFTTGGTLSQAGARALRATADAIEDVTLPMAP